MALYFRGTKIKLVDLTGIRPEQKTLLLVEQFDNDFSFQIVCINGYNSGRLMGYLGVDPIAREQKAIAVTKDFLIKGLKNILLFDESTLEIYVEE